MKKLPKPKHHHETDFRFEVFSGCRVYIIFTDDIIASVEYIRQRDDFHTNTPRDRNADGLTINVNNGNSYVILENEAPAAGTIAHEAWHVVYAVFKYMGVKLSDDEAVAYHLGYVVQKIVDFKIKLDRRANGNNRRRSKATNARRDRRSRTSTK
jgi:hypothetical protein